MITPKNQAAIAVLNDIYAGGDTARTDACRLTEQDMDTLLSKLSSAGLIKLSGKGDPDQRKNLRVFFFKHTTSSVYIKRMPYLLPL